MKTTLLKYNKKYCFIFGIITLLLSNVIAAQNIDSLLNIVETEQNDSIKVKTLNELSEIYINTDLEQALQYSKKAWKLSKLKEYKYGLAISNFNIGKAYEYMGKYLLAIDKLETAINLFTELGLDYELAEADKHLGIVYETQGKYDKALSHYLKALKLNEELDNKTGIASCMNSIGLIYYHQNDFPKAMENFNKTLELVEELQYDYAIAITLNNIGLVYEKTAKYDTALTYYNKAISIHKKSGNLYDMAIVFNNIANTFFFQDNAREALKYYNKALEISTKINDGNGIATAYRNIGSAYKVLGQYDLAEKNIKKGLQICLESGDLGGSRDCYYNLSGLYSTTNRLADALDAFKQYTLFKDSIFDKENLEYVSQLQEKHNAEKLEQEIKLLNKDKDIQQTKIKQQKVLIYIFIIVSIIILGFLIMLFRLFRHIKKVNLQLEAQNHEIKEKNELIEEKNKEIMDSIRYAKRIQEAILPPDKLVKESLETSFVLFKPKDIVSGDFYWMETRDGKILFSAVDCTGHGVPGAFMSIIGHNGLSQTVNEYGITTASKILDKLNELVQETLRQTDKQDVKDGMDLALCVYDEKNNILEYAGANNPLYLIRKKGKNLIINNKEKEPVIDDDKCNLFEIKATKQAIGASDNIRPFENNIINIEKGDSIFIFSDGFADQFGGAKGKKFKYKPFKKLLLQIEEKTMSEQREILNKTIDDWRGDIEQIDDICIIGAKF